MSSAVDRAYSQAEPLLVEAGASSDSLESLQGSWTSTRAGLQALVEYSNSLSSLADVGRNGAVQAEGVASAFNKLLAAIQINPIPAAAVEVFKTADAYVAQIRATKSLAAAITKAQPGVEAVARILTAELDELLGANDSARIQLELQNHKAHRSVRDYWARLRREDDEALDRLSLILDYEAAKRARDAESQAQKLQALNRMDGFLNGDAQEAPESIDKRHEFWLSRSRMIQQESLRYRSEYLAMVGRDNDIELRIRQSNAALKAAKAAVSSWADSHEDLARTLRTRSATASARFSGAVANLKEIVKQGN